MWRSLQAFHNRVRISPISDKLAGRIPSALVAGVETDGGPNKSISTPSQTRKATDTIGKNAIGQSIEEERVLLEWVNKRESSIRKKDTERKKDYFIGKERKSTL